MAFTVFVDGAKLCCEFSWNGVACTICVHWLHDAPDAGDFQALADTFAASYATNMMLHVTSEIAMGDVVVYDLSEEHAPKYTSSDENGTPGTDGTDSIPNNSAGIISHRSATTGRSGRGRNYIPGISEAKESGGTLGTAIRNSILAAWATIVSDVAVDGWTLQVAQRFEDGVQLTTGVMHAVTTEIMKQQLGTQRRRQVQTAS